MAKVKINDWVAVEYTGKLDDGTVFDSNKDRDPLKFQVGKGMVIPGFDAALIDMAVDEEKEVTIEPKLAYGAKNDKVVDLPKTSFQNLDDLEVGKELTMNTNLGPMVIDVKEVLDETIKVVLNHPLAGKTLIFNIKLTKILDDAEAKELMAKYSAPDHSCSGDCEGCSDCSE